MTSTITITNAAALWYPVMLAQERGESSEAKAAELLGMDIVKIIAHRQGLFTNPS